MKIYTAFPFFNELDILDIRLNMLDPYVDKHILVEARFCHQNKKKPLYYQTNEEKFKQFKNKIHHVIIDKFPEISYWGPENYQRNLIIAEIVKLCDDEDVVFIGDADELPDIEKLLPVIKTMDTETIYKPRAKVSYFYFNLIAEECGDWMAPIFAKAGFLKKLCNENNYVLTYGNNGGIIRKNTGYKEICIDNYTGWHFSYSEDAVYKVQNFVHSECSHLDQDFFDKCIKTKTNPFTGRQTMYKINTSELENYLPKYVFNNLEKYKRHILT